LIVTTEENTQEKIGVLKQDKEVLVAQRDQEGRVALQSLMKQLAERGISSLLVDRILIFAGMLVELPSLMDYRKD
ncbi:MAG: hypothetical protein ACFFDC_20380, partial [Promethearchaeota archaeon]